jgi:hypothetical protein
LGFPLCAAWNHSLIAKKGFLHSTNYGAIEINRKPKRASILADFVNYVFVLNKGGIAADRELSQHWRDQTSPSRLTAV